MKKEINSGFKLKLGRKKYVIYYTFIPAKREGDDFPSKSVEPATVEVNYIMKRRKILDEDEMHELWIKYEELIKTEALKTEWNRRVDQITKLLDLKK